jgi:hypothetical protein
MSIFREFLEFRRWKREQRRWRETHKVPRQHQTLRPARKFER